MKEDGHVFINGIDAEKLDFVIDAHSLLIDFKVLLKEYYTGTFTEDGNALKISFNNGQTFLMELKEIK